MKREEALWIVNQVNGRQYHYMKGWGLSLIKMALYCLSRVKITKEQAELCEDIQNKINRKY